MNSKEIQEKGRLIIENIGKVIIGKEEAALLLLTALLADGNVLLEDLPGTGKTTLAKALAASLDADFSRIQFTPDLLPSDITGLNVYNRKENEFVLHKGPVFTNILLADEINRATPRTQAGLLECMEEHQVTIDGTGYKLEEPFFVMATQNPVETTGTYPLPEAQLDRFMMKLSIGLPDREEEMAILERFMKADKPGSRAIGLGAVVGLNELSEMKAGMDQIFVHPSVISYVAEIASATRSRTGVIMGVSPRASLALIKAARAYSALQGRDFCIPDDVKKLAVPVLSHRMALTYGSQKTTDGEACIREILDTVTVPPSIQ